MADRMALAPSTETGFLGVYHLKRLWSAVLAERSGQLCDREDEELADRLVIDGIGLGLQQTMQYLYQNAPTFSEFEEWIVETAGRPDKERIDRLNADFCGRPHSIRTRKWLEAIESGEPVLTTDGLESWEENGYVVVRQAVSAEACRKAEAAIWDYVGGNPNEPETWYEKTNHGIMVELIQHAALDANRSAARIHRAFSQLWGTADLWVSADRCGFHPPQRYDCPFPGPDLHWDIDFRNPPTFGTQGILYLTDTPPEQGALTLVPGFHRRFEEWLRQVEDRDSQHEDLHALGSTPVGGSAGDLVIWHQLLPHGSRPNLGTRPRVVQYINMYPGKQEVPN